MNKIKRIHHITAIGGSPKENYAFYHEVLGLRLVKQTVNFDDPRNYHFYFSNKDVDLGTILTFFPWDTQNRGVKGSGQVGRIAFSIPNGSLAYWQERLANNGVETVTTNMFGKTGLAFEDPHTVRLAMVEIDQQTEDNDVIGFYGVELLSSKPEISKEQLIKENGLEAVSIDDNDYYHLETIGSEKHHIIIPKTPLPRGREGVGTVHHVAWSMENQAELLAYQNFFEDKGYNVTEVKDRNYFKSIYVREKGHVLYEYATDDPGFAVDEPADKLGEKLMLPEQYETRRAEIEAKLPEFRLGE